MTNTHVTSLVCDTPEEQETLNSHVVDVFEGMATNIRRGKIQVDDFHFIGVDQDEPLPENEDEVVMFVRVHYKDNDMVVL